MTYRIRNWEKHQHYSESRKMHWIKVYRDLLDDMEWFTLAAVEAKFLVNLWLLASETFGQLPEINKIAFRLRMSEKDVTNLISRLDHWIICTDSEPLADGYTQASLDKTREDIDKIREDKEQTRVRAKESANTTDNFAAFWQAYPRRVAKGAAQTAWKKMNCDKISLQTFIDAIDRAKRSAQWKKDNGQFIPHPATWLNQRRWEDEPEAAKDIYGKEVEDDADYDPFG